MRLYRRQPRGFTLLEVIISTGSVGIMVSMVLGAFSLSDDAVNEGVIQTELDMKAASIVERIANDLKDSVGTVTIGGTTYPAYDSCKFSKADGGGFDSTLSPPGFPAGSTISYTCTLVTRNGQVFNCLQRTVTSGVTTTVETLTDELSGDPSNGIAALGDDPTVGSIHKIRIPTNPVPGSPVPSSQQVSRAVYIAATAYASNNAGNVLYYVDIGVTLARVNYRRQRNSPTDPTAYTQLGYAHTQVKLSNNCSISTNTTGVGAGDGF